MGPDVPLHQPCSLVVGLANSRRDLDLQLGVNRLKKAKNEEEENLKMSIVLVLVEDSG